MQAITIIRSSSQQISSCSTTYNITESPMVKLNCSTSEEQKWHYFPFHPPAPFFFSVVSFRFIASHYQSSEESHLTPSGDEAKLNRTSTEKRFSPSLSSSLFRAADKTSSYHSKTEVTIFNNESFKYHTCLRPLSVITLTLMVAFPVINDKLYVGDCCLMHPLCCVYYAVLYSSQSS